VSERIPTGRVRRTAKVGGLVGRQTARSYAARAADVVRSEDAKRSARERRQIEAAEQIVEVLGQMKGAAMKVGQVASFIDLSGLPPDARDRFQGKLATLRDSAPRVDFDQMRKVIETDLDASLDDIFSDFECDAVAAASIGQVYRARLLDGRRVAVKVQYPRVAAAVRADLQNLGLLLRAAKRIAPGIDPKSVAAEVRERLTEELDYEHEAQSQRTFARRFRGHPFVLVPRVLTELSRERVLVTEWVDGTGFEDVKRLPQAARDRFGEIVFRFFFGSLYRDGHFSGDPHPGNYMLLDDGRVAFLDFGMTKSIPSGRLALEAAVIRAGLEGDADAVYARLVELGFFTPDDDQIDRASLLAYFQSLQDWYAEDRDFTITPRYVARLMTAGTPGKRGWELTRRARLPADALLARRMEGLTLGVLGQLNATGNWHRIMREWLYGDDPSSPLGEQEAAFVGDARRARRAA
jgi:predicted unusual protein kinase regulating ubiquinone biosynthesis (AarF/ABC1/UbiB family)